MFSVMALTRKSLRLVSLQSVSLTFSLSHVGVNPHRFSVFEIVSAYGTVGLSLGIPNVQ